VIFNSLSDVRNILLMKEQGLVGSTYTEKRILRLRRYMPTIEAIVANVNDLQDGEKPA
jgi:hypothetical protein